MLKISLQEALKQITWSAFVCLMSLLFYYHFWKQQKIADAPVGYAIVETAYSSGMMFIFYLFGKIYCSEWRNIDGYGYLVSIYERAILPAGAITFPFLLNVFDIKIFPVLSGPLQLVFCLVIFVFLNDWNFAVARRVRVIIEQHDWRFEGQRWLYLKYPPESRLDLLPQDIILNGIWIALLLRQILMH